LGSKATNSVLPRAWALFPQYPCKRTSRSRVAAALECHQRTNATQQTGGITASAPRSSSSARMASVSNALSPRSAEKLMPAISGFTPTVSWRWPGRRPPLASERGEQVCQQSTISFGVDHLLAALLMIAPNPRRSNSSGGSDPSTGSSVRFAIIHRRLRRSSSHRFTTTRWIR
jgi:hypothetical protein